MEVLVEHDYVGKEPNELTIIKGDIIRDVVKKQGGWWEGTLRDKKGLFPDNFVKVIEKDSSVVLRNRKDASRIRQCRVVFSYKQDHEDELNLNVGDIIDILGEEEEGWWRGVLHGKTGVFPSNFVEEILPIPSKIYNSKENLTNILSNSEPAPLLHAKPTKILCEVKFAYKAQNEDELTLKEGDLVTLLSKDGQDPGWWKGELNGLVGVFPDNFVTLLQVGEDNPIKDEKRPKAHMESSAIKPSMISSQRKSLEAHSNDKSETEASSVKTTPPLPGKKPTIPVKKSPSGSSASGGIFYGLKKKIVDVVDGATGSKNISPPKTEHSGDNLPENAFDDVQRRPLLSDVRATRPKAPGRRPPTNIGRDPEPGVMNGNGDHVPLEPPEATSGLSSSTDSDTPDNKPKLREWEKHRAPWLQEMKLNQAKRGAPGPESKPKPTDKGGNEADEKTSKEPSAHDGPKGGRAKTPTADFPAMRGKPSVPMPTRPQTIQTLSDMYLPKPTKVSPVTTNKTPSPLQKAETIEGTGGESAEEVPSKFSELEQRIARLEELLEKQRQTHEAAVEELRGKLQVEVEMRMKLQLKLERFTTDAVIQQL